MQAVVLFLNDKPDDPTKRLKLAGVRRYAAAAGWKVVPVLHDMSGPKSIPGLLAEHCPIGCIFDADGDPLPIAPRHFAGVPVVFANSAKRAFDRFAGRLCIDSEGVVRAAFRELSVGIPPAYAVASFMEPAPWTSRRIALLSALAKKKGRPCFVFQRKRGESTAARDSRSPAAHRHLWGERPDGTGRRPHGHQARLSLPPRFHTGRNGQRPGALRIGVAPADQHPDRLRTHGLSLGEDVG